MTFLGFREARAACSEPGVTLGFSPTDGSCPFGHPHYRTEVSNPPRLRKRVYGCESNLVLMGFLQGLGEFFPLFDQGGVRGSVPVEFLRLPLSFVGADEIL